MPSINLDILLRNSGLKAALKEAESLVSASAAKIRGDKIAPSMDATSIERLRRGVVESAGQIDDAIAAVKKSFAGLSAGAGDNAELVDMFTNMRQELDLLADISNEVAKDTEGVVSAFADGEAQFEDAQKALADYADVVEQTQKALAALGKTASEKIDAVSTAQTNPAQTVPTQSAPVQTAPKAATKVDTAQFTAAIPQLDALAAAHKTVGDAAEKSRGRVVDASQKATQAHKEETTATHGGGNAALMAATKIGAIAGGLVTFALAAYKASKELVAFAGDCLRASEAAQKLDTQIGVALASVARNVGLSRKEIAGLADDMRQSGGWAKGATNAASAALAPFTNVRGEVFKQTVSLAGDMTKALGGDLQGNAKTLAAALNDPRNAMSALSASGIFFTEVEESVIKSLTDVGKVGEAQAKVLDKVKEKFGGAGDAAKGTFSDNLMRAQAAVEGAKEAIGMGLSAAFEKMLPWAEAAAARLESMEPQIKAVGVWFGEMGVSILEKLGPAYRWMIDTTAQTMAFFDGGWATLGDYITLFAAKAGYTIVKWANDLADAFWNLPKTVLKPLGDAFLNFGNYLGTVFSNIWANVKEFVKGIWDEMNGRQGRFKFRGILEGFEALPPEMAREIARQEGTIEKSLRESAEKLGAKVGDDFGKRYEARRKELFVMAGLDAKKEAAIGEGPNAADYKKQEQKAWDLRRAGVQAQWEDLGALNKRIQQATASEPVDIAKQQLAAQKAGNAQQQRAADNAAAILAEAKRIEASMGNLKRNWKMKEFDGDGKPLDAQPANLAVEPAANLGAAAASVVGAAASPFAIPSVQIPVVQLPQMEANSNDLSIIASLQRDTLAVLRMLKNPLDAIEGNTKKESTPQLAYGRYAP